MAKQKSESNRKADTFTGKSGFGAALRNRRIAIESGNLDQAAKEFTQGLTGHIPRREGEKRNRD